MKATLGEACLFYSGTGFPEIYQGISEGEFPFFKVSDISSNVSEGNTYLERCANYVSTDVVNTIHGTIIPPDTVVFAKIGEALKKNRRAITVQRSLVDNNAMGILPRKELLRIKYFYYFMCRLQMEKYAEATAVPSVRKSRLEQIYIEIPSIDEQIHIEKMFDTISSIIKARQRQLLTLDTLIKARFVEMFGDPIRGTSFEVKKLRDVSESISDGSNVDKKYYRSSGDVLFLRIQNVWFNEFRLEDSAFISDEVNQQYYDTSLNHGDLLITKIGRFYTPDSSLGRVSVYLGKDDKANYSNNIMRVRLTQNVHYEFINALMNLDDYNKYIRRVSVGGTDKRALSKSIIGDLPIVVPPFDMQMVFVEFVHQIDRSKIIIQKAFEETQLLFDSLMQKYFGEVETCN